MHGGVVDGVAVALSRDVCDGGGSLFVEFIEFGNPLDEIEWILGVWLSPRSLEGRNLLDFTVVLGELLNTTMADVLSLGDVRGVEVVIGN